MKIGTQQGIKFESPSPLTSGNQDNRLRSIQKQIADVQKQLQKLAENSEMTLEQKMEKRKELQQQIQDLNKQYMQVQMDIQKERREAQAKELKVPEPQKKESKTEAIGAAAMEGIISASSAMSQVKTASSVKTEMEGQARVLEQEIKLDGNRGTSTQAKQAELAGITEKAAAAASQITNHLSDVHKSLQEANEAEETDTNKAGKTEQDEKTAQEKETASTTSMDESSVARPDVTDSNPESLKSPAEYHPIDVML